MAIKPCEVHVERLNDGAPIVQPTTNWWESGATFNSAAVYLDRSDANDPIIQGLLGAESLRDARMRDGVVALHYRARPAADPGCKWNRSFVGMALFTPALEPLKRFPEPVIAPGERAAAVDHLGVEDPRITRLGDTFYAVYCGVSGTPESGGWRAANCLASSTDLLHWTRHGAFRGDFNGVNNKDGVLFPDRICGRYALLHRPMAGAVSDYSISLAQSSELDGVWRDCGPVLRSRASPEATESWVGAGSVPIPLGRTRYLVIYHTGNNLRSGGREYDLDAAIFDFERFSPADPAAIVTARLDRFMAPETEYEIRAPFSDSVANVLFTCGSYELNGYIYIIYGGGDSYTMAARVRKQELIDSLEERPLP